MAEPRHSIIVNNNMKRKIILVLLFVLFVVLSNILFTAYLRFASIRVYDYHAMDTEFTYQCTPAKSFDLEKMLEAVQIYDQLNSTHSIICRKFSINYLKF